MKKRLILTVFAIVAANFLFVGCYGGIALDVGYYNNSITVINTATTDDDGRLDILVNGAYYATIYNSSKSELVDRDATTIQIRSGFSNVPINWNYEIQVIGKKNEKTVAAHFAFYATSYAYGGGNHQTWIVTDEQLQPYRP